MEALKVWARAIFLLAIFSSTVLLIVPKSMQKQSRFVAEMLLLLCVVAPLGGLLSAGTRAALMQPDSGATAAVQFSLGKFYAEETARRVTEIGQKAGLIVESVSVTTKDAGFSLAEVLVRLKSQPEEERLHAFVESLSAYLGIQEDRLRVVVGK
ncbi:MAG: hypothetical protein WD024_07350 [Bacillota bacterium]